MGKASEEGQGSSGAVKPMMMMMMMMMMTTVQPVASCYDRLRYPSHSVTLLNSNNNALWIQKRHPSNTSPVRRNAIQCNRIQVKLHKIYEIVCQNRL